MRGLPPTIALVSCLFTVSSGVAQTISSRPVPLADPMFGTDPSYGELVLGRTTLTSALRIFAMELQDSVLVPLGHSGNPATVSEQTALAGVPTLRLRHRLDLGPKRYTLYFDRNERLVATVVERARLPRPLRRDELVARYPTLRVEHVGRSAEGSWIKDDLVAPLGPCVSLIAEVWREDRGLVRDLGYVYTCSTKPAQWDTQRPAMP